MAYRIATTQWSQVVAARDSTDIEARRAFEELYRTYWRPLYAYVRHSGADPEEARDLTQSYFSTLLEKGFLAGVDPSKGRFRSFLLASMRHFLSHERERSKAVKRGGGETILSLDAEDGEKAYARRPADTVTPEQVFERRWAMTVLERGLARLRSRAAETGNEAQFEELSRFLTEVNPETSYRDVGETLGMSEGAVATAVHRLRTQYGDCLRAEIAETVADRTQVDDELQHLLTIVRP